MGKKRTGVKICTLIMVAVIAISIFIVNTSADEVHHFKIDAPTVVTAGEPFNVTVSAVLSSNIIYEYYDGIITFYCTDFWAALPEDYEFRGGADNGAKEFTVILYTPAVHNIVAYEKENLEKYGLAKIRVLEPERDAVALSVEVVPMIRFHVSPNGIDFGTMAPGCGRSDNYTLTLYNKGAKGLKITSEVEKEPFEEGVFIDNMSWKGFSKTLPTDHEDFYEADTINVALEIPKNYGGAGEDMEGKLILLAEVG